MNPASIRSDVRAVLGAGLPLKLGLVAAVVVGINPNRVYTITFAIAIYITITIKKTSFVNIKYRIIIRI